MLLAESSPVGDNYWLVLGPIIVVLGLVAWVFVLMRVARKKNDYSHARGEGSHRGVVQGGIIEGDPGQRNRMDATPTSAERARLKADEESRHQG